MPRVQQVEDPIRQHHAFTLRPERLAPRHCTVDRKEFWVVEIHVLASLTIPLRL